MKSRGPISRKPRQQREYQDYIQLSDPSICYFCDLSHDTSPKPTETFQHFYVAPNIFGYQIWDGCKVVEHLMLIPKKHTTTLADLPKNAKNEMGSIIAEYESNGYSFYGRSPDNITKSVAHQHTHLIKLGKKRLNGVLYLRSPHVLLSK